MRQCILYTTAPSIQYYCIRIAAGVQESTSNIWPKTSGKTKTNLFGREILRQVGILTHKQPPPPLADKNNPCCCSSPAVGGGGGACSDSLDANTHVFKHERTVKISIMC